MRKREKEGVLERERISATKNFVLRQTKYTVAINKKKRLWVRWKNEKMTKRTGKLFIKYDFFDSVSSPGHDCHFVKLLY